MLDLALGVWTHMEETLSSGVFDVFIACGKKLNQYSYMWVLAELLTRSSISIVLYSFYLSVANFNQLGCYMFDINTSIVLLPGVDTSIQRCLKKKYNNQKRSIFLLLNGLIY